MRVALRQLKQATQQQKDAIRRASAAALAVTAAVGVGIARTSSSGPYSLAELRRMGHPYRQPGPAALNPSVINRQSGVFQSSWRDTGVTAEQDRASVRVTNSSPESQWMRGTEKMVPRPVEARVEMKLAPVLRANLKQELEKAGFVVRGL